MGPYGPVQHKTLDGKCPSSAYFIIFTLHALVVSHGNLQPTAWTSWYEFYFDVVMPGRFVWKIRDLHRQYGPIVRITPWEVHVNDVEFLDEIYAPSFRRRDKYAHQTKSLPVPLSVGGTLQHDLHRKRREALNPFFSKKSVQSLEPIITAKAAQLYELFHNHAKTGDPINLSDVYFAFSNE
ncbi:MAG: hypothetical protein Q9190_001050 [Brigantiaea leucoxantha]